ncbi:DHH family phosphoesterase [Candidatus Woesearchaeota archaeon]|nr:DHH family phosphoesterase [Candidatus Woesearchaeota archaeon]
MALTQKQYQHIKNELDNCQNPLYFFDDDPDGLSSFLLLYRYKKEGHGILVKTHPTLDARLAPSLEDYKPDKVFILDVALLEQSFVDACPVPIIWIDHHGPHEINGVLYFNPRLRKKDENVPTTYMCYNAVKQDLWIAALGCIADYYIPDFLDDFKAQYPNLMGNEKTIGDIYFNTRLGMLIKIFSFCLKGKTQEIMKNIKILTRIKTPYEILDQETAAGKFIYRRFEKLNKTYDNMLKDALKAATKDKLLVFTYDDDKMSFTGDIANELLYKFPDKIILVGRRKDDDVRMSIRSKKTILPPLLNKALVGLEGYGGGHEYACGANVKQHQFKDFVESLKKNIA